MSWKLLQVHCLKKYNQVHGISEGASDLTWSLGNALGGKKIFGKHADKSVTLLRAETLQKLGDKTTAKVYHKIRRTIYGGKIGKLFSNIKPLYQFSKKEPGVLYDIIENAEKNAWFRCRQISFRKTHHGRSSTPYEFNT